MKKANIYRKEIQFEIGNEDNIDTLMKIADSPEGEELGIFSFQDSTAKGVTGGRKLNPFEFEGKGLPNDNRIYHQNFNVSFEVKIFLNEKGDVELLVAAENSTTHFKFPLSGVSVRQVMIALGNFEYDLINFVIPYSIYYRALACYRKQDGNAKKRKEAYDSIMSNLAGTFGNLLLWRGEKIIEEKEENGITIKTIVPNDKGRNKGSKNLAPKITLDTVIETIRKFKGSYVFPTQGIVAKRLGVNRRTIKRCLENAGIDLKYNDYVHSIISN
jgi:hypothetical protein